APRIMPTARGSEDERALGLDLGDDGHLPKPFCPRGLRARVRSVLRRASAPVPSPWMDHAHALRVGRLEVDVPAREARVEGRSVSLTAREFELLSFLMAHPNRAFRREELLEHVWGYTFGDTSTVT